MNIEPARPAFGAAVATAYTVEAAVDVRRVAVALARGFHVPTLR